MIAGIRTSGERAADIVSNMLNFSRRSDSSKTPCAVNTIIDAALDLAASDYDLRSNYDFRNITITKDYDPTLASISCSPSEVEQVLFNLLKNAAQALSAMDDPPSTPTISISTRCEENDISITITDNGPGMDQDTKKRIFEPFFTTKGVGLGTGLGLSVSYFIITNNHSGTFTVESEPGFGSTFKIVLPFSAPDTCVAELSSDA